MALVLGGLPKIDRYNKAERCTAFCRAATNTLLQEHRNMTQITPMFF